MEHELYCEYEEPIQQDNKIIDEDFIDFILEFDKRLDNIK